MIKREAIHTVLFNNYLKNNRDIFGMYEVKQTRTEKLYFSAFEPQQIDSLMAYEENGIVYKFSDADPRLKPADGIATPPGPAWVVIKFPESFVLIRITEFVNYMNNTQNNYINYTDAKSVATKIIYT